MAVRRASVADEAAYAAERHLEQWLDTNGPVTAYGSQWWLEAEVKFGRVEDIQPYVEKVLAFLGGDRAPVRVVKARKGTTRSSMSRDGVMTIADTAYGRRESSVLHELAHHLSPDDDGHGPRFRAVFVSLLEDTGHPVAARLLEIYFHEAS